MKKSDVENCVFCGMEYDPEESDAFETEEFCSRLCEDDCLEEALSEEDEDE